MSEIFHEHHCFLTASQLDIFPPCLGCWKAERIWASLASSELGPACFHSRCSLSRGVDLSSADSERIVPPLESASAPSSTQLVSVKIILYWLRVPRWMFSPLLDIWYLYKASTVFYRQTFHLWWELLHVCCLLDVRGAEDLARGLLYARRSVTLSHVPSPGRTIFKGSYRHWFDLKLAINHDRLIHILSWISIWK